jgi:hypothetical protein
MPQGYLSIITHTSGDRLRSLSSKEHPILMLNNQVAKIACARIFVRMSSGEDFGHVN